MWTSQKLKGARRQAESSMVKHMLKSQVITPFRTQRTAKDRRIVNVLVTVTALINEAGQVYAAATIERGRGLKKVT